MLMLMPFLCLAYGRTWTLLTLSFREVESSRVARVSGRRSQIPVGPGVLSLH